MRWSNPLQNGEDVMKYLTFLTALLLSTSTFAQQPQDLFQTQKPVLCAPLQVILGAVINLGEEPYAYWTDPDNDTVNLMYVGDGGITIIESFSNGNACIIAAGKDVEFIENKDKKGIDFKPVTWYK